MPDTTERELRDQAAKDKEDAERIRDYWKCAQAYSDYN